MFDETPYYHNRPKSGRATTIRAAETARNQNTLLPKPGLTIVSFVRPDDQYPLCSACARLLEARWSFTSFAKALHLTVSGVLAEDNQPDDLTDDQRDQIEKATMEIMHEEFTRALGDALAEVGLDSAINPFSFCPLPSTSYHVTAWDGINEENLSLLAESEREEFARFFLGLPESARRTPRKLIPPNAFAGIIGSVPMQFRFDGLDIWDKFDDHKIWESATLVARLAPVDESSARLLEQIKERRAQLDYRFASMGRPESPDYAPHVTWVTFTMLKAHARQPVISRNGSKSFANTLPNRE